ncbi:MAG: hypothetical protein R3180_00230 [Marinobacter sp.]|nr:hypothetical protein [Marinobacter sp.]
MSSKKIPVVFTKRVEDRDSSGKKVVIAANTETELTAAQFKKLENCVRRLDVKKPAQAGPAPVIPPVTGDSEGGDEGEGDEGGEGGEGGDASGGNQPPV